MKNAKRTESDMSSTDGWVRFVPIEMAEYQECVVDVELYHDRLRAALQRVLFTVKVWETAGKQYQCESSAQVWPVLDVEPMKELGAANLSGDGVLPTLEIQKAASAAAGRLVAEGGPVPRDLYEMMLEVCAPVLKRLFEESGGR